jgi:hypothetical protein
VNNANRVNAPAFAGASVIAGHSAAQPGVFGAERQVDDGGNEALRIAAPRLTACNRTAPISGDRTVVAANDEAAAYGKNVLKGVSTVRAHL